MKDKDLEFKRNSEVGNLNLEIFNVAEMMGVDGITLRACVE